MGPQLSRSSFFSFFVCLFLFLSALSHSPPPRPLRLCLPNQVSVTRIFKLVDAKRVPVLQTAVLGNVEERIVRVVSPCSVLRCSMAHCLPRLLFPARCHRRSLPPSRPCLTSSIFLATSSNCARNGTTLLCPDGASCMAAVLRPYGCRLFHQVCKAWRHMEVVLGL